MKRNIFLNSYQQAENKLTYNFLTIIELLNDKDLFDFLANIQTAQNPLISLNTVYGGKETNPDGSFEVKLQSNKQVTIFYENKTKRRGLEKKQLIGHLNLCGENDILLVTSPRKSDIDIVKQIADNRIVFKTWQEISLFFKKRYTDNVIIQQFVEYGKISGEFDELGELYIDDIKLFCEYIKIDFDRKIESIFRTFSHDVDFEKFGFTNISQSYNNGWGRNGIEFKPKNIQGTSYGQFGAISLYYDTYDHEIPFLKNVPEIVFFFDVTPDFKHKLQSDIEFLKLLKSLENEGFENNIGNEKSKNQWRLLYFRRPITEFQILNVQELVAFSNYVLNKIIKNNATKHKYFSEFL